MDLRTETTCWGAHGAVVTTGGDLDSASANQLRDTLHDLIEAGRTNLVIDMRFLELYDSVGLAVLAVAARKCAEHGGWLRVVNADPVIAAALDVAGLGTVVDTAPVQTR
ncbi:STAS domain-containing protein [Longispora sp. K20-0274]|uniref:STAS domain-containing protein n=1 Tax=Longispora sp. K20-0274 TaxID=3088255 RepID=UPI00399B5F7C